MRAPLTDTDPEAARVHRELLRRASPAKRLALAISLSKTVIGLARRALRRGLIGEYAEEEAALRFVELNYGPELAAAVRARLRAGRQ